MSLTGATLQWGLVMLTVAAFAATVILWPRVAAGRWGPVAARVGMLVTVNVLVLTTAAVQLNDQFLFFAGWADLRGAVVGVPTTSGLHRGGATAKAVDAVVEGPAAMSPQALEPLPKGTLISADATSYRVTGPLSGITAEVIVTLPDDYALDRPQTRYPVLETFSGYPGAASQWVSSMGLPSAVDSEVAAGVLGQLVIVSPQWEVPAGVDTECVDGPAPDAQVETWLTRDVPNWVAAHFRVRTDRQSWATLGMSAGGWCAAMAAVLHPAQYAGAIVMAGYFRPIFEEGYEPFAPHSADQHRYDLVSLLRTKPPPVAMWLGTSHADALSYATSSQVLAKAKPPLAISATVLENAGHRTQVWLDLLPAALTWLGTNLPGFAA